MTVKPITVFPAEDKVSRFISRNYGHQGIFHAFLLTKFMLSNESAWYAIPAWCNSS